MNKIEWRGKTGRALGYDHYRGYSAEHHFDVEAVCTTCHAKREKNRRDSGAAA